MKEMFYTLGVEEDCGGYAISLLVRGLNVEDDEEHYFDVNINYISEDVIDLESLVADVAEEVAQYDDEVEYTFYLVYDDEELLNRPYDHLETALCDLLGCTMEGYIV